MGSQQDVPVASGAVTRVREDWLLAATRRLPAAAGTTAVLAGALVLAGWVAGLDVLKAPIPGLPSMKANTAAAFLLTGIALLADGRQRRPVAAACALGAGAIGVLTLVEYLAGVSLGIDELLVRDDLGAIATSSPGRMSPLTALSFTLAAVCIILAGGSGAGHVREGLASGLVFVATFVLGSYAYGAQLVSSYTQVAPHTALLFLLLGPALVVARPTGLLARNLLSPDIDGQLARRLLPAGVALPLGIGWIRIELQRSGLLDTSTGAAMFAATMVVALVVASFLALARLRSALSLRDEAQAAERSALAELRRISVERKAFFERNLDMMAIVGFDGRFKDMNPAWATTLGHPLASMVGRPFLEFVHPDDVERTQKEAGRLSASGEPLPFENRYRRADGSYAWLRWTSTTSQELEVFLATAKDVTAEKESQAQLAAARDRFVRVFEASPVPIALTRDSGKVEEANAAWCRASGYTREELVDLSFNARQLYDDPEERDRIIGDLRRAGLVRDREVLLRRKDGDTFPALLSLELIDLGGNTMILSLFQDLSLLKRVQKEREERIASEAELERLRRTDRFRAEFVNSTAHELRTPLTPLALTVATLRQAVHDPVAFEHSLEILQRSVDRLGRVVGDMVAAADLQARAIALDLRPLDLTAQLRAAVASHQAAAQRAHLALRGPDDSGLTVLADEPRLQLVLGHFLGNAIKFTPPGGEVRVSSRRSGDHARVEVQDTGAGLTRTQMDLLWKPYSQAHDKAQRTDSGSGLGLYVAKGIVDLHRGEVGVSSAGPGKGSTFWFTLPLAPAP